MKKQVATKTNKKQIFRAFGLSLMTFTALSGSLMAFAASNDIVQFALSTIGKFAFIPAILLFAVGGIQMGMHGEEGPEQQKGRKKIAGGIIVAAVAAFLIASSAVITNLFQ